MPSKVSRRRSPAADPVSDEVAELIRVVGKSTPPNVQRWLQDSKNRAIDDELDQMVVWVKGEWDPELDEEQVMHFIRNGLFRQAYNNIVRQLRVEMAKELLRHKRSEVENFIESCVEA